MSSRLPTDRAPTLIGLRPPTSSCLPSSYSDRQNSLDRFLSMFQDLHNLSRTLWALHVLYIYNFIKI